HLSVGSGPVVSKGAFRFSAEPAEVHLVLARRHARVSVAGIRQICAVLSDFLFTALRFHRAHSGEVLSCPAMAAHDSFRVRCLGFESTLHEPGGSGTAGSGGTMEGFLDKR